MTDTPTLAAPDARLPDLLAARARAASDTRLALDLGGGTFAAAAALFWRPAAWVPLLAAALCFAAFGLWGIADRSLATRPSAAARALRAFAGALGSLAGIALLFGVVAFGLGRIIS